MANETQEAVKEDFGQIETPPGWGPPRNIGTETAPKPETKEPANEQEEPENQVDDQEQEETQESKEVSNEQDQPEESQEESQEAESDAEGESPVDDSFFEGLAEEEEESESEPQDVSALAKQLGFEAKSLEELKSQIEDSRKSPLDELPETAKAAVENIIRTGKVGGSVDEVLNLEQERNTIRERLEYVQKDLDAIANDYADRDSKLNFLEEYSKGILKMKGDDLTMLMESYQDMSDAELIREFATARNAARQVVENQKVQLESKLNEVGSSIESLQAEAAKNREAAKERITTAINEFEDPVDRRFSKAGRQIAKKAFNSKDVQVTLPEGVARALLYNEKGQMDPKVIVQNLSTIKLAAKKGEYQMRLGQEKQFDDLREPQDPKARKDNRADTNRQTTEDFSDIENPWARR